MSWQSLAALGRKYWPLVISILCVVVVLTRGGGAATDASRWKISGILVFGIALAFLQAQLIATRVGSRLWSRALRYVFFLVLAVGAAYLVAGMALDLGRALGA